MKKRSIRLNRPVSPSDEEVTRSISSFALTITQNEKRDLYSTVERFRKKEFPGITVEDMVKKRVEGKISLSRIVTLHNAAEIQGRSTSISGMQEKIESGKHVLMPDGLPNIKVTKASTGELVCFDGHHSLLAYMMAGKGYLHEVPHLMVTDSSGKGINDEELHAFFGHHAKKLTGEDWRNYTISWTNPPERQLEERKQDSMGELLFAMEDYDSGV